MLQGLVIKGAYSGVESPITPDGPDVLGGGEGVEGVVGDGVVSGSLIATDCVLVYTRTAVGIYSLKR
jgi:hypothetical protein